MKTDKVFFFNFCSNCNLWVAFGMQVTFFYLKCLAHVLKVTWKFAALKLGHTGDEENV